jgi:predicted RNase H-like nuclease (RuvC/YqgF family)
MKSESQRLGNELSMTKEHHQKEIGFKQEKIEELEVSLKVKTDNCGQLANDLE